MHACIAARACMPTVILAAAPGARKAVEAGLGPAALLDFSSWNSARVEPRSTRALLQAQTR